MAEIFCDFTEIEELHLCFQWIAWFKDGENKCSEVLIPPAILIIAKVANWFRTVKVP